MCKENVFYLDEIKEELKNIWSNFPAVNGGIVPIYQKSVPMNAITFLSLNPSNNKDFYHNFYNYPEKVISYPMLNCNKIDKHPHFKKFYEIGKAIGEEQWAAMELLYIQDSNQKNIEKITDHNFIIKQMKITFEIFSKINPKVVIVANRYVDFLIHKFSKELDLIIEQPSKENGCTYLINKIPFIIRESKFMGSRILWSKDNDRKKKLYEEITKIKNNLK